MTGQAEAPTGVRIGRLVHPLPPEHAPAIWAAVDAVNHGTPTAVKRGRNPRFPYVPIVDYGPQSVGMATHRTAEVTGLAFTTRQEAVDAASDHIGQHRASLAVRLAHPRERALREYHGLPRDLT